MNQAMVRPPRMRVRVKFVHFGQEGLALDDVGNVAVADGVEGCVRDDDGAGFRGDEEDGSSIDEPSGQ